MRGGHDGEKKVPRTRKNGGKTEEKPRRTCDGNGGMDEIRKGNAEFLFAKSETGSGMTVGNAPYNVM